MITNIVLVLWALYWFWVVIGRLKRTKDGSDFAAYLCLVGFPVFVVNLDRLFP